jgi:hypothetical protein
MCRVLVSLILLSLSACSLAMDQTDELSDAQLEARYAQLDARLRGMAGADERQLLGAMGRMPDTTFYRAGDEQTRILQWWWDTPSCSSKRVIDAYTSSPVRESFCIVEWTVAKDISQTFHWQGYGCRSIALANDLGARATPPSPSPLPRRLNGLDAF